MHMFYNFYYNQYLYETLWLWEKKKSSHASMFHCNITDYNWRPLVPNVGQGFCHHGLNKATDFPFISAWDLLFCLRYGAPCPKQVDLPSFNNSPSCLLVLNKSTCRVLTTRPLVSLSKQVDLPSSINSPSCLLVLNKSACRVPSTRPLVSLS